MRNRPVITAACAAATALGVSVACAQTYPTKPIRVLTSETGGGSDFVARVLSQALGNTLGQRMVVDSRGIIAAELVAKAAPDGHTLLLYGNNVWIAPLLRENVPWDPLRDFAPVTLATTSPNVLVVHPALPVKTVKDLIALAKASPGELNYGSGAAGATSYLAVELFKSLANVDIVRVAFKGSGPALTAVISGEVQVMMPTPGSIAGYVKTGRLRAIAVTSAKPSALLPDLPTVAASGVPGYEATSPFGVFAPAETPPAVINLLNREMVRALQKPEIRERLFSTGVEPVASSPEEFAATIRSEIRRWGKLIKETGMRG